MAKRKRIHSTELSSDSQQKRSDLYLGAYTELLDAMRSIDDLAAATDSPDSLAKSIAVTLNSTNFVLHSRVLLYSEDISSFTDAPRMFSSTCDNETACPFDLLSADVTEKTIKPAELCPTCPFSDLKCDSSILVHALTHFDKNYGVIALVFDKRLDSNEDISRLLHHAASKSAAAFHAMKLRANIETSERKLSLSEDRYHLIFDSLSSCVAVYEPVDGGADFVFRAVNRALENVENVKREDILGRRVTEVFSGVIAMGLFSVFQDVYRTGKPHHHPVSHYEDGRISDWRENFVFRLSTGEIVAAYEDKSSFVEVETALSRSEKKFESVFASSPSGIVISRITDGMMLEANDAFCQIYGYKRDEVIGRTSHEINLWWHPADRGRTFKNVKRNGEIRNVEILGRTKSGRSTPLLLSSRILKLEGEQLLISVTTDIADKKMMEESVREREERLEAILNAVPDPVFRLTRNGRITDFSATSVDFLAVPPMSIIGKSMSDIGLDKADLDEILKKISSCLDANTMETHEYSLQVPEGMRSFEIRMSRCSEDEAICIIRDITNELAARRKIAENAAILNTLINATDEMAVLIDRSLRHVYVNDIALKHICKSMEECIGREVFEFLSDEDSAFQRDVLEKVLATGEVVRFQSKRGGRILSHRIYPVFDSSLQVSYIAAFARDITEELATLEKARANEERFQLAFQTTPDVISVTTLSEGRYVDVNMSYEEVTGYSRDEVIGKTIDELGVYDSKDDRRKIAKALQSGQSLRNVSFRFRTKDGRIRRGLLSAAIIFIDNLPHVFSITRDIEDWKLTEEALAKSHERFEHFVRDISNVAIHSYDSRGNITFWNRGCEDLYGYSEQDVFGRNIISFLVPQNKKDYFQRVLVDEAFTKELPEPAEREVITKQGKSVDVYSSFAFVPDSDGSSQIFCVDVDISDLHDTAFALVESEERFRTFFESSRDILFITDKAGRAIWGNYAWREQVASAKSSEQFPFKDIHPEDLRHVEKAWQSMLETGKSIEGLSFRIMRPDGTYFCTETSVRSGSVAGQKLFFCSSRDITEQINAELALQKSERNYRLVSENATESIFIVQDQRLKFPNPATLRLLECTEEEAIEKLVFDSVHPDDRAITAEREAKRLEGEDVPNEYSFRLLSSTGKETWISLSVVMIEWEGKPATLNFARDITQQKELENRLHQSQKIEAIGQLAGGVAHDFNNLLSPIMGYADMLLLDLSPQDRNYTRVSRILEAAHQAKNITQQLLAFGRKQMLAMQPVDLNIVVEGFENMLRRLVREDISVFITTSREPQPIFADTSQIHQILINLSVNASDAMPNGGKLIVTTSRAEILPDSESDIPVGTYALLTMSDSGTGIDESIAHHIFEPFFTTKESGKGTGLGLATVHGIVGQHKGHIRFESPADSGTTFMVYIPLDTNSPVARKDKKVEHLPDMGSETILVAEDNIAVRDLIVEILTSKGYNVLVASDPHNAIEVSSLHPDKIDLMISDVVMPQMDGRTLYEKVNETRKDMKVLYISGYTDNIIIRHGVEGGQFNFLQKPFTHRKLTEKVREILNK